MNTQEMTDFVSIKSLNAVHRRSYSAKRSAIRSGYICTEDSPQVTMMHARTFHIVSIAMHRTLGVEPLNKPDQF